MLSGIHNHTSFCDGQSTAEQMVLGAIERGFVSIGLSGHAYTPFDLRYAMRDTDAYIQEVRRLQKVYAKEIEVYLGAEENVYAPVARGDFDYIIGSSHYLFLDRSKRKDSMAVNPAATSYPWAAYPIDSSPIYFEACLDAYEKDYRRLAEDYYSTFCQYILSRRPDVVGHFDLITKFDENEHPHFLGDAEYHRIAAKYLVESLRADAIYEVNTGAISRGYRKTPYPYIDLLHLLKKHGARVTVTTDSHAVSTLDFGMTEAKAMLRDVGFTHTYILHGGEFRPDAL